MKNIESIFNEIEKQVSQKYCKVDSIKFCPNKVCTCKKIAEIRSYIRALIPSEFETCSINDFKGRNLEGEKVLDNKYAIKAKKDIIKYCWNLNLDLEKDINKFKEISNTPSELNKYSIIDDRRKNGNNLVIFGSGDRQMGRTLLASIVLKEVIKQKVKPGKHIENYNWVQFKSLKQAIIDDDKNIMNYQTCDWLVVDNISNPQYSSVQQQTFITDKIDPFFLYRLEKDLPTIFIFRFDIFSKVNMRTLESNLGMAISDIVKNKKTTLVELKSSEKINE